MKKLYTLLSVVLVATASQAQVVISQIYGGGSNTGATFANDFIELYNRGTTPQNLEGWSVQYTSQNGPSATAPNTNWAMTPLPAFVLEPGKYFLIKQGAGTVAGAPALPTPDLDGVTLATLGSNGSPAVVSNTDPTPSGIAMSGSNGKVILVSSTVQETTPNPTGSQIIDKVAYGTTPTAGFEGSGPTGTALSATTSAQRNNAGATDTDDNKNDFTAALPVPRNNSGLNTKQNAISGLNVYPNPVANGNLFITSSNSSATKSVAIFDVLGKQVIKTTVSNQVVNVSKLISGVYILKITEEGKTATRKLVIK
ncbi:lamin tail domain-containing protein [Flavobacterium myungsuense]|uniref:Lamin tail domain-containing protein n=1 Tax=Flavobacterium myungsuense TaxID=651823 RepID=A0ABW3J539_9FLAO